MNNSIKISLLVFAIIFAVGGVMAYYKTIVSPPGKLVFKNQYVVSAKKDIANVEFANTDLALDSVYYSVTHILDFQFANSNLSDQERDELFESFATQFVTVFVSSCNSKFNQSYWDESQLHEINARISELQHLSSTDKRVILQGDANKSLNVIHNIIVDYYDAKRAATVTGYSGIQFAKQRISLAGKYAAMSPLKNCIDLVNRLNCIATRLERAHYVYLSNQVELLADYHGYSKSEYEQLALFIAENIDEYKKQARITYGYASDVSSLEDQASYYYNNAKFE